MNTFVFRLTILLLAVVLFFGTVRPFPVSADSHSAPIQVWMNNEKISFDVSPVIRNGRTLVPFRPLFEKMGADITWNQETRTVTAWREGVKLTLQIGNPVAYVGKREVTLDIAPQIIDGRTMVPLRFAAETLGKEVHWDERTRTITLRENPVFIVKGDTGISEETKQKVKTMLEQEIVPYLESKLPVTFEKTYTIKLHSDKQQYAENFPYGGEEYAENTLAVARLTTIMVANFRIFSDAFLKEVLTHEMVHVGISHMGLRGKVPLWFEEGLAERIRHEAVSHHKDFVQHSDFNYVAVVHAAARGELLPLDFTLMEHNEGFFQYRTYDHYEWSVRQLEEVYGYQKLIDYLTALQSDMDYREAFSRTFRINPAQFQRFIEERLKQMGNQTTAPFRIRFTVDASFAGRVRLLEYAASKEAEADLEENGEEPYETNLGTLSPGTYELWVFPEEKAARLLQNGTVLHEAIALHEKQGTLYLSFDVNRDHLLNGTVVEHVITGLHFGYGTLHYDNVQAETEDGKTQFLNDSFKWEEVFRIDAVHYENER